MFHLLPQEPVSSTIRPLMTSYMAAATGLTDPSVSPGQWQAIQDAADRARAYRSWKPRRR